MLLAAFTVKRNAPAAAGVPDITPPDDKLNPVGSEPDETDHVTVPLIPDEVSVWLYGVPTVPLGSAGPEVTAATAMESVCVATALPMAALAVKLNVPLAVGVPDITPFGDRVNPAGNEPDKVDHVGDTLLFDVSCWL